MTANSLRTFAPADLKAHPWQKNIPNIEAGEWTAFVADVRSRGVKEPIRVSLRTGEPVVVDGHQRLRAAREVGYQALEAIAENFADEGEEITFLAGAARFRRHLTDPQRQAIGKAYREFFKASSDEAKRDAGKKFHKGSPKVTADLQQPKRAPTTTAKIADLVGMTERQLYKADAIDESNLEPVKKAWHSDEISTHAAHELTKAPNPIQEAINNYSIPVDDGILVNKDKDLRKDVADGRKTVPEAVSIAKQAKEARQAQKRELDYDIYHTVLNALEAITALELPEYHRASHSGENAKYNVNAIEIGVEDAIAHLNKVAEAIRIVNSPVPNTITLN